MTVWYLFGLYIPDFYDIYIYIYIYAYIFYDMIKFYLINNSLNYNVPKLYIFPFKFLTLYIFYFKLIKKMLYVKGKKFWQKNNKINASPSAFFP